VIVTFRISWVRISIYTHCYPLFHGSIEGIHVDVGDFAHGRIAKIIIRHQTGCPQRSLSSDTWQRQPQIATLSIEFNSDSFVASAAASIATGWNEPVPGRELHPLKSSAFHGALLRQLTSKRYHRMGNTAGSRHKRICQMRLALP